MQLKAAEDDATAAPLVELYEQHSGDLVAIFAALGDNPGKAIKYPPSDAREFASKYIGGFYTYIDIKSAFEKAGLTYKDPASEAAAPSPSPAAAAAKEAAAAAAPAGPAELPPPPPVGAAGGGGGDMRGISVEGLSAQLVRLKKTPVKAADAAAGNGPSDAETASLIAYVTIVGHRID